MSHTTIETTPILASPIVLGVNQLAQSTRDLIESMLQFEKLEQLDTRHRPDCFSRSSWAASVRIQGEWSSEVHVLMTESLAERIAFEMFAPTAELSDEEIVDAVGETASIIGENVRGVVNQDSNLSLPCVGKFDGLPKYSSSRVLFRSCSETLWVSISEWRWRSE